MQRQDGTGGGRESSEFPSQGPRRREGVGDGVPGRLCCKCCTHSKYQRELGGVCVRPTECCVATAASRGGVQQQQQEKPRQQQQQLAGATAKEARSPRAESQPRHRRGPGAADGSIPRRENFTVYRGGRWRGGLSSPPPPPPPPPDTCAAHADSPHIRRDSAGLCGRLRPQSPARLSLSRSPSLPLALPAPPATTTESRCRNAVEQRREEARAAGFPSPSSGGAASWRGRRRRRRKRGGERDKGTDTEEEKTGHAERQRNTKSWNMTHVHELSSSSLFFRGTFRTRPTFLSSDSSCPAVCRGLHFSFSLP